MNRVAVRLSEAVSVEDAVATARANLTKSDGVVSAFALQVEQTIRDIARQGSELSTLGSSFAVTRTMSGEGSEVTITAAYGQKPSLLKRLLGR